MTDTVLPANLKEIMAGDQAGYRLGYMYFLEIEHGLMGTFEARFKKNREPVIVTDLEVLKRVAELLEPRRFKVGRRLAYINDALGWVARLPGDYEELERCVAGKFLTKEELDALLAGDSEPFEWRSGLLDFEPPPSREEYLKAIAYVAAF